MKAIAEGHQAVVEVMLANYKVTEEVQYQKTLLKWAIENEHSVLIKVRVISLATYCTSSIIILSYWLIIVCCHTLIATDKTL